MDCTPGRFNRVADQPTSTAPIPAAGPVSAPPFTVLRPQEHIAPIAYKPGKGEFITQTPGPTSYLGQSPWRVDPGQPTAGAQIKKFGFTRLNPNVKETHDLMVAGPFWTPWAWHSQNNYTEEPWAEAIDTMIMAALEKNFDGINGESFTNILKNIYDDARTYGVSVSEVNWFDQDAETGFNWMSGIKTHSPFQFDLYTDGVNELQSIYYYGTGQRMKLPVLEKMLVVTYPWRGHGNLYGESALIAVLPDVQEIVVLEQALNEGARALAIKPLLHYYLANSMSDEQLNGIVANLQALQSGSVLSFASYLRTDNGDLAPMNKIVPLEDRASVEGLKIIHARLELLYKRVARNMGFPDEMGFTQTNVGSNAKAQEQTNLLTLLFEDGQEFIENFVNRQIIPLFIKYNFPELSLLPNYRLPSFRFGILDEESSESIIYPMIAGFNAQIYSRGEVRKTTGFTEPIDENDTLAAILARTAVPGQQPATSPAVTMPNAAAAFQLQRTSPRIFCTYYSKRRFHTRNRRAA
jgi:hypothetical protein